jgi:hypothetical protein
LAFLPCEFLSELAHQQPIPGADGIPQPLLKDGGGTAYPSLSPHAQRGQDARNLLMLLGPEPLEGTRDGILADAHGGECGLDADHDPARHVADVIELRQLSRLPA